MKWNNIQLGVWLMNGQANRSIGLLNPIACHHSHRSVIVPVPCDTSLARAVQCTRSSTIIKISQDIPSPEYQTKSIEKLHPILCLPLLFGWLPCNTPFPLVQCIENRHQLCRVNRLLARSSATETLFCSYMCFAVCFVVSLNNSCSL